MPGRVSLAPPPSDTDIEKAQDKWADPAMPENSQLLLPHTQQLLRIARSGRYGTKRKIAPDVEPDGDEFNAREEEGLQDDNLVKPAHSEEKGFVARKWRQVPENALIPEHLHWEFLAKRRKGLPNFYHGAATEISTSGIPQIAKRKTRVQRVLDPATGESAIYEVLALEGQVLENELPAESQMQAKVLQPGTTIEGLGTVNEEGLISLVPANPPAPSRRSRPPPKKKGGPGRGKKRVTFTNPDGSTYTTIVPNATKIVPQPGQTVKHVAKGEDADKDVAMGEAPRQTNEGAEGGEQDEDGDDDEEGDDGDDDDDEDREDGEIPDDDAEVAASPVKKATPAEPRAVDPMPVASTSTYIVPAVESAPTDTAENVNTQNQPPVEETKPDADVEMQDRPADDEIEANTTELESVPAAQPEPQSESMPEPASVPEPESMPQPEPIPEPEPESEPEQKEQTTPEDIVPEAVPTTDAKPDSEIENTHKDEVVAMDDAMDTDPVEAPVQNEAAPQEEQQGQPAINESPAPPADVDQPTIVTEVETSLKEPEGTQGSTEQTLGDSGPAEVVETAQIVEVSETAEGAAVVKTADVVVEATEPDAQAQQETTEPVDVPSQEPPAQAIEEKEDLLGSLEKSLGS
jgi:hypothetical protein